MTKFKKRLYAKRWRNLSTAPLRVVTRRRRNNIGSTVPGAVEVAGRKTKTELRKQKGTTG